MKKSVFIDDVCAELRRFGIGNVIIESQRTKMDAYLTSLGIGEDSEELDDEDPRDFAVEIVEALVSAGVVDKEEPQQADDFEPQQADDFEPQRIEDLEPQQIDELELQQIDDLESQQTDDFESQQADNFESQQADNFEPQQVDDFEDEVDDVKPFVPSADFEEEDHSYTPPHIGDYGGEEATLEFSAVYENTAEYENIYGDSHKGYEQNEYSEPEVKEDFIDIALKNEKPLREKVGNPTPFWILFGLFSPLILVLAIAFFALCGAAYALLALFMVLHIPMIVIAIGGGSLLTLSEVIYVIVQFAGGHKTVAFFEVGVAIALVGIIILITVGFKYLGKRSPRGFYYLTKIIRFAIHKIKRGFRWLKGVCSI